MAKKFGCPPKPLSEMIQELEKLRELAKAFGSPPKKVEDLKKELARCKEVADSVDDLAGALEGIN